MYNLPRTYNNCNTTVDSSEYTKKLSSTLSSCTSCTVDNTDCCQVNANAIQEINNHLVVVDASINYLFTVGDLSSVIVLINDISQNVYDNSQSIIELNNEVDDLSGVFHDLSATVQDLSASVYDLSGEIYSLPGVVADLSAVVLDLSGDFNNLSTAFVDLSGTVADLSGDFNTLNIAFIDLSGVVADLSSVVLDLSGDFNTLNTAFVDLSGIVADLSSVVLDLSGDFNTLSTAFTDLSGIVEDLSNSKVDRAGDTMTGNLTIDKSTPQLILDNTSNQQGIIEMNDNGNFIINARGNDLFTYNGSAIDISCASSIYLKSNGTEFIHANENNGNNVRFTLKPVNWVSGSEMNIGDFNNVYAREISFSYDDGINYKTFTGGNGKHNFNTHVFVDGYVDVSDGITFTTPTAPASITNKLYRVGNELYWDNDRLSVWDTSGTSLVLDPSYDNIIIPGSTTQLGVDRTNKIAYLETDVSNIKFIVQGNNAINIDNNSIDLSGTVNFSDTLTAKQGIKISTYTPGTTTQTLYTTNGTDLYWNDSIIGSDISAVVHDLSAVVLDLSGDFNTLSTAFVDLSGVVADLSSVVLDLSGDFNTLNTAFMDLSGTVADLSSNKVSKSGDTMTGNLTIDKSTPQLVLDNASNQQGIIEMNDNGNFTINARGTQLFTHNGSTIDISCASSIYLKPNGTEFIHSSESGGNKARLTLKPKNWVSGTEMIFGDFNNAYAREISFSYDDGINYKTFISPLSKHNFNTHVYVDGYVDISDGLTFTNSTAPSSITNKLYRINNDLYWDNDRISVWDESGTSLVLDASYNELIIPGSTTKLGVDSGNNKAYLETDLNNMEFNFPNNKVLKLDGTATGTEPLMYLENQNSGSTETSLQIVDPTNTSVYVRHGINSSGVAFTFHTGNYWHVNNSTAGERFRVSNTETISYQDIKIDTDNAQMTLYSPTGNHTSYSQMGTDGYYRLNVRGTDIMKINDTDISINRNLISNNSSAAIGYIRTDSAKYGYLQDAALKMRGGESSSYSWEIRPYIPGNGQSHHLEFISNSGAQYYFRSDSTIEISNNGVSDAMLQLVSTSGGTKGISQLICDGTNFKVLHKSSQVFTTLGSSFYFSVPAYSSTGALVTSDKRIKKNIQEIKDDSALQIVKKLEPKTYGYIDTQKGDDTVYGFIAQEIQEIFPPAVKIERQVIPDILKNISISGDVITFETDIELIIGNQVEIRESSEKNYGKETTILSKIDSKTYTISDVLEYTTGYCYGNYVDDFHYVMKERLIPILWSATQQVIKEQDLLKLKVQTLEIEKDVLTNKVFTLEQDNTIFKQDNAILKQQVADMEARLKLIEAKLQI